MGIREQFNSIAETYDANRKRFIPCFEGFYSDSTHFIAQNIKKPERILDLGAGTGLLTAFWNNYFKESEFVLVDMAEEMLEIAKRRFGDDGRFSYLVTDYSKELPSENFDAVISALSIHHLTDAEKSKLFERICDKLPIGGVFVNYDQFVGSSKEINNFYNKYWEEKLKTSGLSQEDLRLWKARRLLDKECGVSEEISMLKSAGFKTAEVVYLNQKFAVILAIK